MKNSKKGKAAAIILAVIIGFVLGNITGTTILAKSKFFTGDTSNTLVQPGHP